MGPSLEYETRLTKQGFSHIAGLDEAGIGPLAGPIVAAAVVLDLSRLDTLFAPLQLKTKVKRVTPTDSKQLGPKEREALYPVILSHCLEYGVGWVYPDEINIVKNIQKCGFLARFRAISQIHPDYILSDHFDVPETSVPSLGVTSGDNLIYSVSAASVVAKVTRDRYMDELSKRHPEYGFDRNKGYGTDEHIAAIRKYGVTPQHKVYYNPIPQILYEKEHQN